MCLLTKMLLLFGQVVSNQVPSVSHLLENHIAEITEAAPKTQVRVV